MTVDRNTSQISLDGCCRKTSLKEALDGHLGLAWADEKKKKKKKHARRYYSTLRLNPKSLLPTHDTADNKTAAILLPLRPPARIHRT
jgi:hypothetical protein